jgi:hypothetical protein
MVVGDLRQFGNHLAAILEALLGLVLRMADPIGVGVEGAGFGNHVRRAEMARIANDRLQVIEPALALVRVRMDDVGIAGNRADRQVVVAERLPHCFRFFRRDGVRRREVDILESEVELHGVETERLDALRLLDQIIRKVTGEDSDLKHEMFPRF